VDVSVNEPRCYEVLIGTVITLDIMDFSILDVNGSRENFAVHHVHNISGKGFHVPPPKKNHQFVFLSYQIFIHSYYGLEIPMLQALFSSSPPVATHTLI